MYILYYSVFAVHIKKNLICIMRIIYCVYYCPQTENILYKRVTNVHIDCTEFSFTNV